MAEEKKVLNIFQKMLGITNEMGIVAKNLEIGTGKATYKAVAEGDVLASVKPLEKKYGIYSYPCKRTVVTNEVLDVLGSDGNVRKQFYCVVETTYRFVDTDKPEDYIEVTSYGTGIDSGDKSYGKSCTYADKYALLKAYKIVTGEDPDQEASKEIVIPAKKSWYEEPATQPQKDAIIKAGVALTEEQFNSLTKGKASEILNELKNKGTARAEFANYKS